MRLPGSEPAFEVAPVDDAEHEEHSVFADDVVRDAVVAYAEAVEGVRLSPDCLHPLAPDACWSSRGGGELFEGGADALAGLGRQLRVGACGGGGEAYLVGVAQTISPSGFERPRR